MKAQVLQTHGFFLEQYRNLGHYKYHKLLTLYNYIFNSEYLP